MCVPIQADTRMHPQMQTILFCDEKDSNENYFHICWSSVICRESFRSIESGNWKRYCPHSKIIVFQAKYWWGGTKYPPESSRSILQVVYFRSRYTICSRYRSILQKYPPRSLQDKNVPREILMRLHQVSYSLEYFFSGYIKTMFITFSYTIFHSHVFISIQYSKVWQVLKMWCKYVTFV